MVHDPLPGGLYADVGAEHFTRPGYEQLWKYVEKFDLPAVPYPRRLNMLRRIDGQWYTEEQLQDRRILQSFGFNAREIDFIARRGWTELPLLYFESYLDAFEDEYEPFNIGLDDLDEVTAGELLEREGASDAGIRFNGVRRFDGGQAARNGEVSALFRLWQQAIIRRRGLPVFKREVFRVRGGNQKITDAFAERLGPRVRLGCPMAAIERGESQVTVHFREFGEESLLEAEYLVCCIPLAILRAIPVTPAWPGAKQYVLDHVQFGSQARVLLQARTPFWKGELLSINLETGDDAMYLVYETADEVPGERTVLMGSGASDVTADQAFSAFRHFYPGREHTVERAYVHNWAQDPWAFGCERLPYPLGTFEEVLAADRGAGRPHPLRGVLRGQPPLGHGRGNPISQPHGRRDRPLVADPVRQPRHQAAPVPCRGIGTAFGGDFGSLLGPRSRRSLGRSHLVHLLE